MDGYMADMKVWFIGKKKKKKKSFFEDKNKGGGGIVFFQSVLKIRLRLVYTRA